MDFWQGLAACIVAGWILWLLNDALDELKTISQRLMHLEERLEEVAEQSRMAANDLDDLKSDVADVRKEVEELNWHPPQPWDPLKP
jgi:hypothetical protein